VISTFTPFFDDSKHTANDHHPFGIRSSSSIFVSYHNIRLPPRVRSAAITPALDFRKLVTRHPP
jgi:hypothetical protein